MKKAGLTTTIEASQGDITRESVDVIVNAANESLLGGGGVDGAIHAAAGPQLLAECRLFGGCAAGDVRMTDAYSLPATKVIHTVGPRWYGGGHNEANLLQACYTRSLKLADEQGLSSIAFPAISTGAFGYPLREATGIAVLAAQRHSASSIRLIRFVCFDAATLQIYLEFLRNRSFNRRPVAESD
jgi:O-acetyl-ADP-ribose deacetylase (regulator of RNase III)